MGIKNYGLVFFFIFATIIKANISDTFTPADNYLIDCGSSTNTTVDGRTFVADASLPVTLTAPQSISAKTTANSVSSLDSSGLYQTARVFTQPSSYSFPIQSHGRHFIRLYFFPFVYQAHNLTAASFTVSTQDSVLLNNFQTSGGSYKEFSANITRHTLIVSFIPSGSLSLAFVNAIEVVSVPDYLIADTAQTVNPSGSYNGLSDQTLETIYRINMGGPKVLSVNDTLWRTWVNDGSNLLDKTLTQTATYSGTINHMKGGATDETAPDSVYGTAIEMPSSSQNTTNAQFNITWQFGVDAGNTYLIRMHFCDIVSTATGQLYFNVYIGGSLAVQDLDLTTKTFNTLATAYFMDFVVGSPTSNLRVSIGPSSTANVFPNAILNGLEIMSMNSSGSAPVVNPPSGSKSYLGFIIGSILGVVAAAIVVCVLFMMLRRRKQARKQQSKTWLPFSITGGTTHSLGSRISNGTTVQNGDLGYRFSFLVLQEATNDFNENLVIGVGGFGKVYQGVLRDDTKVAVKRGNPKSQQGFNEFRTEIELLSRLRHRHLVSLIGFCDERNEMILVYEYMENGSLKSHLYNTDLPSLTWKQRLEICIGSARGLHYLHTGQAKAVIHRDVKSANILLDENLMAKVADFGLSKTGPELDQTHVSTAVKGSFGYLDPEYFRRQQLTEKSDVYSFGVVLLEVFCARPVIDPTLPREMVNLAEWGMKWQKRGELDQIVDARLSGTIRPDSLRKFGETVEKCLADYGVERPTMGDVLWNLEYVLQLQDADSGDSQVNSMNRIIELSSQVQNMGSLESVTVTVTGVDGGSNTNDASDLSDVSMSRVFSQLIKSEGRWRERTWTETSCWSIKRCVSSYLRFVYYNPICHRKPPFIRPNSKPSC